MLSFNLSFIAFTFVILVCAYDPRLNETKGAEEKPSNNFEAKRKYVGKIGRGGNGWKTARKQNGCDSFISSFHSLRIPWVHCAPAYTKWNWNYYNYNEELKSMNRRNKNKQYAMISICDEVRCVDRCWNSGEKRHTGIERGANSERVKKRAFHTSRVSAVCVCKRWRIKS